MDCLFLFWFKYPKLSNWYAIYCLTFIVINQVSQYTLGCCVLTTISNYLWSHSDLHYSTSNEWFSVKLSNFIFGLTPSHYGIKIATETLIAIAAIGGLVLSLHKRK